MKKGILGLVFIGLVLSGFATPKNIWKILNEIKFKMHFDEKLKIIVFERILTESVKDLDGKIIKVKGFFSINEYGNQELWSCKPFNYEYEWTSEESNIHILKINSKDKILIPNGTNCKIKGRFKLDTTNLELPYILNEVECLDCEK